MLFQKDLSFKFKIEDIGEYSTNFKKMDSNKKASVFFVICSGELLIEWSINLHSMISELNFLLFKLLIGQNKFKAP